MVNSSRSVPDSCIWVSFKSSIKPSALACTRGLRSSKVNACRFKAEINGFAQVGAVSRGFVRWIAQSVLG